MIKKIKFPKDELDHKKIIEWWYFNGHLKDAKGSRYAYMNCLFKAKTKEVKIPFLEKLPIPVVYFSHEIFSDINNKKTYTEVHPISVISADSFSKPMLFVNYTNPSLKGYINYEIEETERFKYHIKTDRLDLWLTAVKKPLLVNKKGYIESGKSYYYSLTNLETRGMIKIKNKWVKVKGKSWMDHQWADAKYQKNKWVWFSIQLDNNTEILCFEYDNLKNKTYSANISYTNKQIFTDKIRLTPTSGIWQSPVTKAKYPLSWKIEIPSQKIKLKLEPILKKQEIIFNTINYWEGPLAVSGTIKNKKVKGNAFLELVGFPTERSYKEVYKDEIKKQINQSLSYIKRKAYHMLK